MVIYRPSLGSQELSLLRCQGMAEGNRLPSLENAPHLKTDGEFFLPLRLSCKESSTSNQAFLLRRKDVNRPPVLRTAAL